MSIDDEYAAIGIDLRALRRRAMTDLTAPAANAVELKLGRAILRLRLYLGRSQSVPEERSGVDQTVISRLERGLQRGLSFRRLHAILRALQVGEIVVRPRPPAAEPTSLERMLRGDPWERAEREADGRLNRRRSA